MSKYVKNVHFSSQIEVFVKFFITYMVFMGISFYVLDGLGHVGHKEVILDYFGTFLGRKRGRNWSKMSFFRPKQNTKDFIEFLVNLLLFYG